MTDEAEWGPWIEHDGKGCPCVGAFVHVVHEGFAGWFMQGQLIAGSQGGFSWDWRYWLKVPPGHNSMATRVIRYRIRKPRGMTILESLLENLPEEVDA